VLLPLTVALVLAGLGLLLAGLVRDALGLIYLSILCTAIAGVALIVYVQVGRRQAVRAATEGDPVEWRAGDGDAGGSRPGAPEDRDAEQDAPGVPRPSGPDADVEPPAASGGRQGGHGDASGSDTGQGQPDTPPGTASGEDRGRPEPRSGAS
jgi:hypothetical protein